LRISNNLYVKEYRMTAKEKAEELVLKCINVRWDIGTGYGKEFAFIAVDEVLGYMGADRGTEFWQEVKKEIEKL
jgi:hypothetical protein